MAVRIPGGSDAGIAAILRRLRLTYRIETQRFFAVTPASKDGGRERGWLVERSHDFHIVLRAGAADAATTRGLLTKARRGLAPRGADVAAMAAVLDDFHDCAAKADGPRYFDHFAPKGGASFLERPRSSIDAAGLKISAAGGAGNSSRIR